MIIQLRYILDIPYHNLLPKMRVLLACIDVLQHLRKETDLVWKNPPVFEEETKKIHEILSWRTRTPTLTLNSGMNIFCPSLCFCCGLGADMQVVWTALQSSYSLFFKSTQQMQSLLDAQDREYDFSIKWVQTQALSTPTSPQIGHRVFTFGKGRRKFRVDGQCRSCGCLAEGYSSGVWQNKTCTVCMLPLLQNTQ